MSVKYHNSGLWIEKINETSYRIGLSEKGQDDVGEVIFVELPEIKEEVETGSVLLNVEGEKAVTEITIPFRATITAVHEEVEDNPELLNKTDKESNWIVEVTDVDPSDWEALDDEVGPLEGENN
ncbi:glycine cleavage system protein GcvH [Alkalibacterium iburiense]|uniref:Glycine cleavage system protein GcvH n=1 Tax=Alkalibacterium iburiense TaxID=290589 RepID=A0ABP3HBT9_9LACT